MFSLSMGTPTSGIVRTGLPLRSKKRSPALAPDLKACTTVDSPGAHMNATAAASGGFAETTLAFAVVRSTMTKPTGFLRLSGETSYVVSKSRRPSEDQ